MLLAPSRYLLCYKQKLRSAESIVMVFEEIFNEREKRKNITKIISI